MEIEIPKHNPLIGAEERRNHTKMVTIKQAAETYKAKATTKNIAELPEVSTDFELIDDEFEYKDTKTNQVKVVKQKVVNVNGENYRVPNSVVQQLNVMVEDNPNLKKFKVKRSGTGMESRYTVIPLV